MKHITFINLRKQICFAVELKVKAELSKVKSDM